VLESVSRLMLEVTGEEHRQAAQRMRELLSIYREHEDLISIGAYRSGSNPTVDRAIAMQGPLNEFLCQRVDEPSNIDAARRALIELRDRANSSNCK
jgi:flagellum-specific ATP synthase